ncbi:MAG TPA: RIP metalloprotease RseP [Chromatiales bacterium]|nr:RIP metalloprotease RseP [Chromatiales bacterium]
MSALFNLAAFVVTIGILVTFHEFGHFWVARRLGIRVLRFSVGFGRALWKKVAGADRVEYVIAAIPLGGYVKMLDEREGPVPEAERPRAFNRQPVWKRMAVVSAGPAANLLLAVIVYWCMYMVGVQGLRPVVGEVLPGTPAAASGLTSGDEILSIAGRPTPTWQDVTLTLLDEALGKGEVVVNVRTPSGAEQALVLDLHDSALLADEDLMKRIGIEPWRPQLQPVIGKLVEGGPAERSGLRPGDRIVAVEGRPVETWSEWVEWVRAHPGQRLRVTVEREGRRVPVELEIGVAEEEGRKIGRIGAYPRIDETQLAQMRVTVRYGPVESLYRGAVKTWDVTVLTLKVLWKLVTGQASLKNISGPVTIAEYAGVSAAVGLSAFLGALGLLSVSIGILNLLPIPVLDGGHLLFYLVEAVKGSPVSDRAQEFAQRVGFALLGALMILALYNDLVRVLR